MEIATENKFPFINIKKVSKKIKENTDFEESWIPSFENELPKFKKKFQIKKSYVDSQHQMELPLECNPILYNKRNKYLKKEFFEVFIKNLCRWYDSKQYFISHPFNISKILNSIDSLFRVAVKDLYRIKRIPKTNKITNIS